MCPYFLLMVEIQNLLAELGIYWNNYNENEKLE